MEPLISIIIPNYNRADLIGETLDSIIAQNYTHWECIVVDDHSTDDSWSIVEQFCNKDIRINQLRRPDKLPKGACSCRNYGFELSNGVFINWFDSDDIMDSNKLEIQVSKLINDEVDVVICQTQFFEDEIGNLMHCWNSNYTSEYDPLTDFITFRLAWSTNAPLWRKSFLVDKDLFNTTLGSSQDWEFHGRMLCNKLQVVIVNETFVFNRMHANRVGVLKNKNRKKTRLTSRLLLFEEIRAKGFFNKEIKNYFATFFMNQLIDINTEMKLLKRKLIPSIKMCTDRFKWYFNFYPRILIFLIVFKVFGKRHLAYKYLIKQVINENRK